MVSRALETRHGTGEIDEAARSEIGFRFRYAPDDRMQAYITCNAKPQALRSDMTQPGPIEAAWCHNARVLWSRFSHERELRNHI